MTERDPSFPLDRAPFRDWLRRIHLGDPSAWDEVLRLVGGRLGQLTRGMLRSFPGLRGRTDADDVLQDALLRLLRSLRDVEPGSPQEFFALAATQVRRELLDQARRAKKIPPVVNAPRGKRSPPDVLEVPDRPEPADELDRWARFHRQAEQLPALEREVVALVFYHGWTQRRVAELFQVDVRTVKRRWQSALRKLRDLLREEPGPDREVCK